MSSFALLATQAALTAEEISELLGVPIDQVSKYVDGEIRPSSREIHVLKGMASVSLRNQSKPRERKQEVFLGQKRTIGHAPSHFESQLTWDGLAREFRQYLQTEPPSETDFKVSVEAILGRLNNCSALPEAERRTRLYALVNKKFEINAPAAAKLFALAARKKISFNYHDKIRIMLALDRSDKSAFLLTLQSKDIEDRDLRATFQPAPYQKTISVLHKELTNPTLTRKDSRPRDWSEEIRRSIFGGFVFSAFEARNLHSVLDSSFAGDDYEPDFWRHLHKTRPSLFSRARTLVYMDCDSEVGANAICHALKREFASISNHGFFALRLKYSGGREWRTAARVTLFAEKFIEQEIKSGYFRWRDIAKATCSYVDGIDESASKFSVANLGYDYKDTFVLCDGKGAADLLLLFQKNLPDETPIPCPTCRSGNVQGNSYSSLGVKSWECSNPLCPDRSKFDRGKRYSFYQLLKQQAIEHPDAAIPSASVRAWSRDVQPARTSSEAFEMLLRHYTLPGDGVQKIGEAQGKNFGRKVSSVSLKAYLDQSSDNEDVFSKFSSAPFFQRFAVKNARATSEGNIERWDSGPVSLILGDCVEVLATLPEAIFDGAVTSPPYYNAREYTQWPNIYCYLYDMFNIAEQVFRTLKPGAIYLFNIFDYFDNENAIVQSAMGQKRMILSSYCVELFERIGFTCEGNIVWDKGAIEGKRAFNNGNFSPYYQAPFNCWEHILIFKKPGSDVETTLSLPGIVKQKPVIKMVRGINRHGHTAPFPDRIPELLLERLRPDSFVLDPFAGSMTTGRVASRLGHRALCIEKSREYFELGRKIIKNSKLQFSLFERDPSSDLRV